MYLTFVLKTFRPLTRGLYQNGRGRDIFKTKFLLHLWKKTTNSCTSAQVCFFPLLDNPAPGCSSEFLSCTVPIP